MKSALQQALSAIGTAKKSLQTQASGAGKRLMKYGIDDFQNDLKSFIANNTDSPIPQDRKSKSAIPVASLDDGGILYSDGSARMPGYQPTSPAEEIQLNVLRQNLLQQIPYTPEAQAIIRSMPQHAMGLDRASSGQNNAGGFATPYGISINRNALYQNGQAPNWGLGAGADILSHEILHYLDDNVHQQTRPNSVGNSMRFSKELKQYAPKAHRAIVRGPLANTELYDSNNEMTRDVEEFAYYGQKGPRVLLNAPNQEVYDRYSRIYQPMTKNVNMTPRYPTQETMNRITSQFNKQMYITNDEKDL